MLCAVDESIYRTQALLGAGIAYIWRFVRPAAMPFHISVAMFMAIPLTAGNAYPFTPLISAKMSLALTLSGPLTVIMHKVAARNIVAVLSDLSGDSRGMPSKLLGDLVERMSHADPDLDGKSIG